jgi:hypothetical protein
MDSTASPKVKTSEGEGVGAHSLACNTLGVKGHVGASKWDYDERQVVHLFTGTCTNQTTSWLMCSWNTLAHG